MPIICRIHGSLSATTFISIPMQRATIIRTSSSCSPHFLTQYCSDPHQSAWILRQHPTTRSSSLLTKVILVQRVLNVVAREYTRICHVDTQNQWGRKYPCLTKRGVCHETPWISILGERDLLLTRLRLRLLHYSYSRYGLTWSASSRPHCTTSQVSRSWEFQWHWGGIVHLARYCNSFPCLLESKISFTSWIVLDLVLMKSLVG